MTDPLCRKNWNVYEHYLYLNPNADLKIIKEEAEFFQDLREQISKLTFGESSLHTEDCPDFERQTYFAISKWNLLSGVLNLCELGSYIAADPSSTVKYTPEKYNETLDGFIT